MVKLKPISCLLKNMSIDSSFTFVLAVKLSFCNWTVSRRREEYKNIFHRFHFFDSGTTSCPRKNSFVFFRNIKFSFSLNSTFWTRQSYTYSVQSIVVWRRLIAMVYASDFSMRLCLHFGKIKMKYFRECLNQKFRFILTDKCMFEDASILHGVYKNRNKMNWIDQISFIWKLNWHFMLLV